MSAESLAKSALVGAFSGTCLALAVIVSIDGGWTVSEAWSIPIILVMYSVMAAPFTGVGLCVFGLPLAMTLRPLLRYRWSAVLALALGALGGQIFFDIVVNLLWGHLSFTIFSRPSIGMAWGTTSALSYWYFERSALLRRGKPLN
ncbi:hypothetical protein MTR62_13010 [Novosphingobium sp. 1949]|uniref:Uncharacterized protein n=1 Tax=Novosphingobium organovorum TaxID=2930092 RepID=A0ABT0BFH0_9SPHN|nr:hypothetical protein [Novosphingobium organovorum]MCJ2183603.1 hypothetical protein [Novosphingobium organovorum]